MPVPFTRNHYLLWKAAAAVPKPQWYRYQSGNRTQRGEKRAPWAYELEECLVQDNGASGSWFVYPSANTNELIRDLINPKAGLPGNRDWEIAVDRANNKARSRFIERARAASSVQIGETLVQGGNMLALMAKRAKQLGTGLLHLRKGNLRKFFATFGIPTPVDKEFRPMVANRLSQRKVKVPPSWGGLNRWAEPSPSNRWRDRSRYKWAQRQLKAKDPASVWLEYWFVWAPTVNDFHGALKILCNSSPPHGQWVKATATSRCEYNVNYTYWWGDLFKISYGGYLKATKRIQGRVTCINPNRQLYDTMGVSNIPLVLWWATPFSFLADWVVNVSELLDGFQNSMDWILDDGMTSDYRRTATNGDSVAATGYHRYKSMYPGTPSESYTSRAVYMKREVGVGIPEVRLVIALPHISLTRAATAISLLASQLKSV